MPKNTGPMDVFRDSKLSVAILMTGGTIAKSYNPTNARLYNFEPTVKDLVMQLRADDLSFSFHDFMHLDSLEIGERERTRIVEKIKNLSESHDAVLVTHGTDTMAFTAEALCSQVSRPTIPIIFTGAMVPNAITGSDAVQNVTEALLALRLLPAGIYVCFHNRIFSPPDIRKNHENLTFEKVVQ